MPTIITIINAQQIKTWQKISKIYHGLYKRRPEHSRGIWYRPKTKSMVEKLNAICYTLNAMGKLYGLIFDVDGVIADTEAVNARASIKVFADLLGVEGVVRKDFEAGLGRGAEEYVKAGARVHGLELTEEQIKKATQVRQEYFLKILSQKPLPPFPGVLELMDKAIEEKNFRLAIATSGTLEKSRAVLEAANVPYRKMVYINGDHVKNKKPDPELFLLAAERMGIEPANCVVIEDAPNGVQAAKAAGAKCIAVTNSTNAENLCEADLVCDSLEQIKLDMIQELFDSN
ncbi:MAG: HAD family phosphatase [Planctomycetota bacterium]